MNNDKINKGLTCRYCGRPTQLIDSSEIYHGVSHGKVYICYNCNAYVACHRGTDTAMGHVANEELRRLRHLAHEWFDAIWKNKLKKSRYNAYSWLSLRLHLNKDHTHMGLFDIEECLSVISLCSKYIKDHNPTLWCQLKSQFPEN